MLIRKSQGIMAHGRLLLPLRKMGEATGAKVVWDAQKKAVLITKQTGSTASAGGG